MDTTSTLSPAAPSNSTTYGLGVVSIFDESDPSYGTDPLLGDIRPCALARKAAAEVKTIRRRRSRA